MAAVEKRKLALKIIRDLKKLDNYQVNSSISELCSVYNIDRCRKCGEYHLSEEIVVSEYNENTKTGYILCKKCNKNYNPNMSKEEVMIFLKN